MRETSYQDQFTVKEEPPADSWPDIPEIVSGYKTTDIFNFSKFLVDESTLSEVVDRLAVVADDGTWTYGELVRDVQKAATVLKSNGVTSGNRVLLRGPNNGHLVIGWLATLRIGAVAVTTAPLLRSTELQAICEVSCPTHALVDHRFLAEWEPLQPAVKTVIYGHGGDDSFETLFEKSPLDSVSHPTLASDIAILAFTSGTTGKPKATMHSHRDLLSISESYANEVIQPNQEDVFTGTPPLAFTFGLGALLVFPLRFGSTTVLLETPTPENLLTAVQTHGVTCLFTAPTGYRGLLRQITDEDLSSLRCCVSAGEALASATRKAWLDLTGISLLDGIGSTEMLHIFISNRPDEPADNSLGRPVAGYRAMVVDDDLNEVPQGTPGKLVVKGPTGCRYLNDPRQAQYVRQGWNITGDIVTQDAQGNISYISRADDMIISSGYNIAATEVENVLLTHPVVSEAAVVGLPDEDRGHVVAAFIVTTPDTIENERLAHEIQEYVKKVIAPFKYPRHLEFVTALPKTTTGKIQRHRLKSPNE